MPAMMIHPQEQHHGCNSDYSETTTGEEWHQATPFFKCGF